MQKQTKIYTHWKISEFKHNSSINWRHVLNSQTIWDMGNEYWDCQDAVPHTIVIYTAHTDWNRTKVWKTLWPILPNCSAWPSPDLTHISSNVDLYEMKQSKLRKVWSTLQKNLHNTEGRTSYHYSEKIFENSEINWYDGIETQNYSKSAGCKNKKQFYESFLRKLLASKFDSINKRSDQ